MSKARNIKRIAIGFIVSQRLLTVLGGGYMVGDLNADDFLCRVVAENTKSAIVQVDYRLAPEHKWPAQLDDGVKVYKWVRAPS